MEHVTITLTALEARTVLMALATLEAEFADTDTTDKYAKAIGRVRRKVRPSYGA